MVIWYIFGDSPTFEQINATFIVVIIGVLFKIMQTTSRMNRELGEIKMDIKHSFANVSKDINSIKNKMKL